MPFSDFGIPQLLKGIAFINLAMRYLKFSVVALTAVLIAVMAAATCIENLKGTPFVAEHIYGALWFVLLWAALACTGFALILKARLQKRIPVFMLHVSFLVILAGALTTYLTSERGSIHLRTGEPESQFVLADSTVRNLEFALTLNDFAVECYPGTDSPMDYVSHVTVDGVPMDISMNNIGRYRGYRLTQAGYDSDMGGTSLGVLHDPYGIALTYAGYALLLISIIAFFFSRRTHIRELYRKASAVTLALVAFALSGPAASAEAIPRIDGSVVDGFSRICVLYDGRVCPVATVADAFVTKLSGKSGWNGYSSAEIFAGWTFDFSSWEDVPMIRIKDKAARKALGISDQWASFNDFWDKYNAYKLEKPLEEAYRSGDTQAIRHLRDADEKFNIIRMFYNGEMLKMFPCKAGDSMVWLAPGERSSKVDLPGNEWIFVRKSMDYVTEKIVNGDPSGAVALLGKIGDYQRLRAGEAVPSKWSVRCEVFYGWLNGMRWEVMLYLTLSLLLAICFSLGIADGRDRMFGCALVIVMSVHLTVLLVLRWIVSGHVPLSNGFETMQFLAWSVLLMTMLLSRRFPIILGFGPLLASFALLVAMIGSGSPQITPLMPVLHSPLLSVHVIVIMFSYALFAMMMLIGVQGLLCHHRGDLEREDALAALSHLMLYPAVFFLAVGIFIGAIWANVSWGRYWSWDPKEVWALITMLIYAAPLHSSSLGCFRKPKVFHLYCILAFLSVLITYFGVNFILGGMHSYA